jgi:tetratricopeptide (TPR) repeat protein
VGKARRRNEAHKFIEEGKNHLQGDRFQEAVAAFTKARALVPEEPAVPFFRAQAYLGLGETAKALGDARDFSRMLPKDAPQEMREAAEKLTGEIKEREEGIRKFGLQVPILRRDAAKAYKAEQYASAESKLREAISICPAGGKHELECELSIVLANWAVDDVNKAVSSGSSSALDTAERRLKEAARLDASNQHAKANLAALKGMGSSLLRRDAAKAYKADQYALAESKLREAISICPAGDKHELECELSIVLANWAVHDVNQAGPWASSSMLSTADRRLQEALRLDPSNQHARTNLDIVKGMRS